MGEEVGDQTFKVVEFSVDATSGTKTDFVRNSDQHDQALSNFFEKTGADYGRFNYLGEWHSHPGFDVLPSLQDINAMQDLVDGSGGVDFAVLLIIRLSGHCRLDCGVQLFVRDHTPITIDVACVE